MYGTVHHPRIWLPHYHMSSGRMHSDRCAECGFDFMEDPVSLAARCELFSATLQSLLTSADPDVVRCRPAPEIWSVLEYGAHVGEAVLWYVARIRRVLNEELPQLEPFDWDAAAVAGQYNRRNVDAVVADVRSACRELADLAGSMTEDQLSRQGVGSDGSPRSAELLLARAGHELVHHESDLRRGLGPAREHC